MRNNKLLVLVPVAILAAACGRNSGPATDDALKNDLALASQAQPYNPQQFVSPTEQGLSAQPHGAQAYQAVARQPAVYRAPAPVRRTATRSTRSAGSGTIYRAPAEQPVQVEKHTQRDAAIGAAAGAIIGATASRDKIKGGLIGAAVGGILGGVIGNNADVKRTP